VGLVYSLTEKPSEGNAAWYLRPAYAGAAVLGAGVLLNLVFR